MVVKDLISLCCLEDATCYFSDIDPRRICKNPTEVPTAVIDGNCWIYECAHKLTDGIMKNDQDATQMFIHRYLTRVAHVASCGWVPTVVFDGRRVPAKKRTHDLRAKKRRVARLKADKLQFEGKAGTKAASTAQSESFRPSNTLIHRLVLAIRQQKFKVRVSPYEGDAQCAYEAITGLAQLVITRDGDLIAHGCKTIFFWNSQYKKNKRGEFGGKLYWRPDLTRRIPGYKLWRTCIKDDWDNFLSVCVLSGTDYNEGVANVGVKTARKLMIEHGDLDTVTKVLAERMNHRYKLPEGYLTNAKRAVQMFKYALVYDPVSQRVRHCRDLPEGFGPTPWMGRFPTSPEQGVRLARGELDPETLDPYDITACNCASPPPAENGTRRSARRRIPSQRILRASEVETHVVRKPAHELTQGEWKELLRSFGVLFDVPQTTDIPQSVLNRLLQPSESDVQELAGLFSEYRRDAEETLVHFRRLKANPTTTWDIKMLQAWCKTRRMGYCKGPRSKHIPVPELLPLIEKQVRYVSG